MLVKVKCDYCKKKIKRFPSAIRKNKHYFCNPQCHGKFLLKRIEVKCAYCGKSIPNARKRKYTNRFCNYQCLYHYKVKKIKTKCSFCKKTTYKEPCFFNKHKNHFCNKICYGKWQSLYAIGKDAMHWKGGQSFKPYPIDFNEKFKRQIRKRDNYTCQFPNCREKENGRIHNIHHIDYDKQNSNPLNLITLCVKHNARVNANRNYWKGYFQDLTRRKYVENREVGYRTGNPGIH